MEQTQEEVQSQSNNNNFSKMIQNQDNDKFEMDSFFGSERNYVILTNSGKPIFSSKGDIYTLSSVYATLYAMISKVQTYEFAEHQDERKQSMESQIFEADDMSFSMEVSERNESVYLRAEEKEREANQFNKWKMNNLMPFLNKQQSERLQLISRFQNTDELGLPEEMREPESPQTPFMRQQLQEENSPELFFEQEKFNDNELRGMITKMKKFKLCVMTIGGQGSEGCLIYIAMSKNKNESISHMRKQLQTLHLFLISAGTKSLISNLKQNFNYDILNDNVVREQMPALASYCNFVYQDPAAILNLYLPMRLHPMTRSAINNIVLRHKPSKNPLEPKEVVTTTPSGDDSLMNEEELEYLYYYGIIMLKKTVINIFKNNPDIAVTPADVNCLLNFTQNNTFGQEEYFSEICLPGMTEEFRLPVFFKHFVQNEQKTELKIIFACEDQTEKIQKKLSQFGENIFADLVGENLIGFLNQSEKNMYQQFSKYQRLKNKSIYNIELPDTKCVIIANPNIDQYTHYNMPREDCDKNQLYWIQQFEKLHNIYMRSKKKKEFCIKRVYQMETYLLYSKGDIFIYAVITHKGATREAIEIGKQILADAKEIETTSFIMKHV